MPLNSPKLRRPVRAIAEAALSVACAALALLSALVPDWFERLSGLSPDGGSGAFEVSVVLALAVAALATGWFAHRDWRRWARSRCGC
jgi:hypothetical protein